MRSPTRLLRPALAALALALALIGAAVPAAFADPAPVVVSLQFDDGTADHAQAASILDAHGLDGTFFINSARPGQPGYLGWSEIDALAAAGHEIGGHTLTHANVPSVPATEQLREVCNDRAALLSRGYAVTSFAYPFGATSAAAANVVRDCGYNSGRKVSGIVSAGGCSGCAWAETMPPADPYLTRIPQSVRSTTTLSEIQSYVTAARDHGGGWIQIVMHRICDACAEFAVTAARLDALASWLADEQAAGAVALRTIDAVIGGPLRPAVLGPAAPPPVRQTNGLVNPSLEDDANADATPDCWTHAAFGTSTATWARTPAAFAGSWADRVDVTSITSGARRLLVAQDNGTCAPSVSPGHRYTVTAAYRGTAIPRFIAYRRLTGGFWTYWTQSGDQPAASEWRRESWTTPVVPADTSAISVGLSVAGLGSLSMDDLAVRDADGAAPVVSLTSPADGIRTDDPVTLAADATDASGVDEVAFLVDGAVFARRTSPPYTATLDQPVTAEQSVTIRARAVDSAGNVSETPPRTVVLVPPDTTPPTSAAACDGGSCAVTWLPSPTSIALSADDGPGTGVQEIRYTTDGSDPGPGTGTVYTGPFEITETTDLAWLAIDNEGNAEAVQRMTLAIDADAPQASISCDLAACVEGWRSTPTTIAVTASDVGTGVAEVRYTTDGSTPTHQNGTVYDQPFTISQSADVRVRVWDAAGNASPVLGHDVRIDALAPDSSATCQPAPCPTGPAARKGSVTVTLAATDIASGVDQLLVRVDGPGGPGAWQPYGGPLTITDPSTVRYRAVDVAGNAEPEHALGLVVDSRAPTIVLDEPAPEGIVSGETYIRSTPADDQGVARVRFYLDGQQLGSRTAAPYRWKWDTRTAADGAHTVRVVAEDVAGNTTSTADVAVTVLNFAPAVSITLNEPLPGAVVTGSAVYLRATPIATLGVARVRFFLDGRQLGSRIAEPWRWKWDTRTATNGPHLLRVVAEDTLGRSGTSTDVQVVVANP